MDLKTFVAETISQIVEGVSDAQMNCKVAGSYVNPLLASTDARLGEHGLFIAQGGTAQLVQFDVAITATAGSGTKGGIGVVVAAFTLGSTGQSSQENSASSRVKFCVPLTLPTLSG